MKRALVGVKTTPSLRRCNRQQIVIVGFVIASLVAAILIEYRLAELFDDHWVATMLTLVFGIIAIVLILPFCTRYR